MIILHDVDSPEDEVTVNPLSIAFMENSGGQTRIVFVNGSDRYVRENQTEIRKMCKKNLFS